MAPTYKSNYEEQYCAWSRNSSEHSETVNALRPTLQGLKDTIVNNRLNVLSIGTGDGHFDLLLMQELVKHLDPNTTILYTCVEPNESFNTKFRSTTHRRPAWMQKVALLFSAQKFEEFLVDWEDDKRHYQLILFSHAMNVMPDRGATLTKVVKELLADKGNCILLEVTKNEQSQPFINDMKKNIYNAHGQLGQEEMSFEEFMGETVEQLPQRLGFQHEKNVFDAAIDVTPCFDEQSLDGNLMLDFVTSKTYARSNINRDIVARILDLMATYCTVANGRQLLKSEIVAVTIGKQ